MTKIIIFVDLHHGIIQVSVGLHVRCHEKHRSSALSNSFGQLLTRHELMQMKFGGDVQEFILKEQISSTFKNLTLTRRNRNHVRNPG